MGSRSDASPPTPLDPEAPTLDALRGSDSDAAVDVDRENARSRIRARLFAIDAQPVHFGRYVLLSNLGEGGTGIVYAAYDDKLDRKIAIKVLRPEIAENDVGAKRLLREARAMARVPHRNIVAVHDAGEHDGRVYIAMEFVRGHNAAQWLRQSERSPERVLDVYHQAAQGLIAAHRAGLVHRDFKPHNVLVGDDGVVKVVDFGLARSAGEHEVRAPVDPADSISPGDLGRTRLTQTGALLGTPAYMSPEQYAAQPVDTRSDQFSFCVALHEALYGEHPFETTSLGELMASICEGRVREPTQLRGSPAIRTALLRGMAVEPDDRFASMEDLVEALRFDPARRRRRWINRGLLAAAVFAGGFWVARVASVETASTLAPCDNGSAIIGEVWDEPRRQQVESAILAHPQPYAADTWERADEQLDLYSTQWAASHDDACEKHRDGEQSGQLLDLRMACLQRHRAALDTLATILADDESTTLERAVDAVMALPPLSRCSDTAWLLADVAPPADPEIAQQVQDHRATLARVQMLEHAGRWAEGQSLAEDLVHQARALGYAPLVAQAQLRLGGILLQLRRGTEAKAALDAALEGGVATGSNRVAAEALARRLFVEAELLDQSEVAQRDIPLATALADAAGAPGIHTLLLNNVGVLHSRLGDLETSQRTFEQAVQRRGAESEEDLDVLGLGVPQHNLALALIYRGYYGEALEHLEVLSERRRHVYGPSHPQLLMTHALKSTALMHRHQHRRSQSLAEATLRAQRAVLGERSMGLLYTLEVLGQVAIYRRQYDEAERWTAEALEIGRAAQETKSLPMMTFEMRRGQVQWHTGRREQARATMEATIAVIREIVGDEHIYLANAYTAWGNLLRDTEPEEASSVLHRALKIFEAVAPGTYHVPRARIALARVHAATGELATAEDELIRALKETEAILPEHSPQMAEVTLRLGQVRLAREDLTGATTMLERSWTLQVALREGDDPELALVDFSRAQAQVAVAQHERRTLPADLLDRVGRVATRLSDAGPGYAREQAEVERWLAEHETAAQTP